MENANISQDETKFRELLQNRITDRVSSVGKDLMTFRENLQQSSQNIIDKVSEILSSVEEEFLQDLKQHLNTVEAGVRNQLEPEVRTQLEPEIRQRLESEYTGRLNTLRSEEAVVAAQKLDHRLGDLDSALREISIQNSQVDILMSYLDKAASFAPRVALFVLKSGSLVGWQARGFEGEFNNASIKTLIFAADQENFLRRVAESRSALKIETRGRPDVLEVVSKFGGVAPELISAIPLVVRDKPVAVLYADSGPAPQAPIDVNALNIITTVVSLTVELSSARAKLGLKPVESVPPNVKLEPAKDHHTSQLQESEVRAHAPSVSPVSPAAETSPSIPPTTIKEEPSWEKPPVSPSQPVPPFESQVKTPAVTPVAAVNIESLDEADQKLHNEARRFARLLVSEIKLYNEQKVQAGRRDKNLYALLRDDIDKSREMYEKRVSPIVASKIDYFYDELVRILAENQVGLLGADCPGPMLLSHP